MTSTRRSWRWRVPDPNGFLRYDRQLPTRRPVPVRIQDWREVYPPAGEELIREQATRCMDCGIPFCHDGLPAGQPHPGLERPGPYRRLGGRGGVAARHQQLPGVHRAALPGALRGGLRARHRRRPGDDQAGRGGDRQPRVRRSGTSRRSRPPAPSGKRVAVVGSGPAGLAAAQQLARAGHAVTVYERDDRIGGLLRYGIPDFKLEKRHIDRPARAARRRGRARSGPASTSASTSPPTQLRAEYDAVLLACGALAGRDTADDPGARRCAASTWRWSTWCRPTGWSPACRTAPPIDAAGKHVVIIGGGDTGADCLGVAHRQGAAGVHPARPVPAAARGRADEARDPWPTWPWVLRNYPAHEEGGDRVFARRRAGVRRRRHRRRCAAVRIADVVVERRRRPARSSPSPPGSERELPRRPGAAGDRLRRHRGAAAARRSSA